jgi:hypothetical protein
MAVGHPEVNSFTIKHVIVYDRSDSRPVWTPKGRDQSAYLTHTNFAGVAGIVTGQHLEPTADGRAIQAVEQSLDGG